MNEQVVCNLWSAGCDMKQTEDQQTLPHGIHWPGASRLPSTSGRVLAGDLRHVSSYYASEFWEHMDPFSISSVQFSHSVVSYSLWSHGWQHARLPCPSPTPGTCSHSCPLSWWCHPSSHSSSVIPVSSCLQSFPASESFPMSQFFTSCGQSIGASASVSVLPMNIQDLFPLGWTGWISLQSKGLSRVLPNTTA